MTDYIDDMVDAKTVLDDEDLHNSVVDMEDDDKKLLEEGAMTRDEAKELTEAIKASAMTMYAFVKRAHDGKIWKSMGYNTWADYVIGELDMSAGRSYQLINQAKVTEELESAAPDGTKVTITEAQARAIKSELPRITSRVKTETASDEPSVAAKKINEIVQDERAKIKNDSASTEETVDDDHVDDDVQDDSFQDLDPKGSAPRTDRMSASNSGSTADDPIDLDAPVDDEENVDMMNDLVDDDVVSDELNLKYMFNYFDSLKSKRPYEVAKNFKGDAVKMKEDIDEIVSWLQEFENKI